MAVAGDVAQTEDLFRIVGTTLDGKFRVERTVAEGGFGVVYFGTHLALERPIAIKVLKTPPEFNDAARAQFIEKFALEARTIARISHPNIVQVMDFGVSAMPTGEPAPWMVLEWLTGQTLDGWLESRRGNQGLPPAEALSLLRPVFEAVAYAHDEGIAHRDLKPANVILVQSKRGLLPRLLDFGIAKLMEEGEAAGSGHTRTRSTQNAFSPQYAAPEQVGSARTGPWTDVHALALILTEVLTDQPVYNGDDAMSLFAEILSPERPTPAKRGFNVGAWEPVIAKALALRGEERYANASEFLAALEADVPNTSSFPGAPKQIAATMLDGSRGNLPGLYVPGNAAALAATAAVPAHVATVPRDSRRGLIIALAVALALAAGAGVVLFLNLSTSAPPRAIPNSVVPPAATAPNPPPPSTPPAAAIPPTANAAAPVTPPAIAVGDTPAAVPSAVVTPPVPAVTPGPSGAAAPAVHHRAPHAVRRPPTTVPTPATPATPATHPRVEIE